MRFRLADTLDYVFGEVGSTLGIEPSAAHGLIQAVRETKQSPHVFGAYYDLVLALEEDDIDAARKHAAELFEHPPLPATSITRIDERADHEEERYRRLFLSDLHAELPDDALMADCRRRFDEAFALLDAGFPQMSAEIRELLREIVVAAGPEDPKALTFDGASCYMLWGAILLNARGQKTVLDTAQALAHESGHNLLFGFSSSGPLVESGVLNTEQIAAAQSDLAAHARNFEIGDSVVREGGRLTAVGRETIEAAREYMASAA